MGQPQTVTLRVGDGCSFHGYWQGSRLVVPSNGTCALQTPGGPVEVRVTDVSVQFKDMHRKGIVDVLIGGRVTDGPKDAQNVSWKFHGTAVDYANVHTAVCTQAASG
jgi:hypothetical protein